MDWHDPFLILFLSLTVVLGSIIGLRLHAFLALTLGATLAAALTAPLELQKYAAQKGLNEKQTEKLLSATVGERVAGEFGNACGKVGVLIGLASIVGVCVLESGSAERIVRSLLGVLGQRRAAVSLLASGYLLAIPVFFDTVFLLVIPIVKSLYRTTRRDYLLYVTAVVAGATMTHSLVPPTPGPLFVARALGVDLGTMILMGCIVSACTGVAGYLWGVWINRRLTVTPADFDEAAPVEEGRPLPPLWCALLPVALPVLLISGNTVVEMLTKAGRSPFGLEVTERIHGITSQVGEPTLALLITCGLALLLLLRFGDRTRLSRVLHSAILDAGGIIMITAAGGAFGSILQATGIGERIAGESKHFALGLLPLAFLATALIRIAQGSATVAMITSVGILTGLGPPESFGVAPVYLALAIGCGSKPVPWMNDSGFWVICKTAGLTERQTLASITPMSTLMGIVGLGVVALLAWVWP